MKFDIKKRSVLTHGIKLGHFIFINFRFMYRRDSKQRWSLRKKKSISELRRSASCKSQDEALAKETDEGFVLKAPFYVRPPKFIGGL